MKRFLNSKNSKGFGLAEIVVASTIISLVIVALISVYASVSRYVFSNVRNLKATFLAEESAEVLRFLGDSNWTENIASLQNNYTYRLYFDNARGTWTSTTSVELIEDRYDRAFVLSPVYRNSSFNVVSSGGTLDTGSRKAVVTVTWNERGATTTKEIHTYLFNMFNN